MAGPKSRYAEKLKDPRWQKKRLKIFERDGWACVRCKDSESSLQVHHKKYFGEPWECPDEHLETLCESCHEFISGAGDVISAARYMGAMNICALSIMTANESMKKIAKSRIKDLWPDGGEPEIVRLAADGDAKNVDDITMVLEHLDRDGIEDSAIDCMVDVIKKAKRSAPGLLAYIFVDSLVRIKGGSDYGGRA